MNYTDISTVQHSLVASKHKNHDHAHKQTHTQTHAHTNSTHTRKVLGKPQRPTLLSRSRSHVCAHTRDRYAYPYPCPYRSLTHIDMYRHGDRMHIRPITPSHTRSHTLPPLLLWPHTPTHPRSLTHPSDVSRSKMPTGSTLIALKNRRRRLGTRRGGSQPSHSPPAHARCVHQHAHACAPCTCAMHMHVCTVALSLHMRAPCMRVRTCMCL
jgi:hypothetical protein